MIRLSVAMMLAACGFYDDTHRTSLFVTPPAGENSDGGSATEDCVDGGIEGQQASPEGEPIEAQPSLAQSLAGQVALGWIVTNGDESFVRVALPDRGTFEPFFPCDRAADLSMAYTNEGRLLVAVQCIDLEVSAFVESAIRVSSIGPKDSNFAPSLLISDAAAGRKADDPALVVVASRVLVAWSDVELSGGSDAQGTLRLSASDDGGATFGASVEIVPPTAALPVREAGLAASSKTIHLAYEDAGAGAVFYRSSTDQGITFSAATQVASGSHASLAANDAEIWVAWDSGTAIRAARSQDAGASFDDFGALSDSDTASTARTAPAIALDTAGIVRVFWGEQVDSAWSFLLASASTSKRFSVTTVDGPIVAPCTELLENVALVANETFSLAWTGIGDVGSCEVMQGDPCN